MATEAVVLTYNANETFNETVDFYAKFGSSSVHSRVKSVVYGIILPIIFITGLIGNSFNILIFSYKIRRRLHSGYTNVTDMSAVVGLLALALSDFLFSAFALPSQFLSGKYVTLDSSQQERMRLGYVFVHHFFFNLFLCTSTWFTCVISFERFLMICKPFHTQWSANMCRTLLMYCAVITCSVVINAPLLFKYAYVCTSCHDVTKATNHWEPSASLPVTTNSTVLAPSSQFLPDSCGLCALKPTALFSDSMSNMSYYGVYSVFSGFLPFSILLLCNARLAFAIRVNFRQRTRCAARYMNGNGTMKLYRITLILVLVVTMYLFLVTPSICMELLKPAFDPQSDGYRIAVLITNTIQSVNYSINFPIYMLSSQPFRNSFRKLFRRLLRCKLSHRPHHDTALRRRKW